MIETETTIFPEQPPFETNGNSEPLRLYVKNKLALSEQLRSLREIFKGRGDEICFKQCEELMAKLAEDRFTLAVLGQFKRGKSSLMNAIIGRELLPVGVLPLTSAITVLRYGAKERLLIRRENMTLPFPDEFPVGQLNEFVTEKKNPGNNKRVITACVELPAPFLRRGLEFVDTPGIGSAIEANTTTTLNFLSECDAALFVTSVDSPFTSVEMEFLENIRCHVRKIFFVVNKTDLLGANERKEVLDFVRETICKQTKMDNVKIYPVSSRLGLAAKTSGDWADGLESGLADLETAIARFLSSEKASVFLAAIIDRALWLVEQESIELRLQARTNELPENVLVEKLGVITTQWENHKAERRQIVDRLQQRILSEVQVVLMPELISFMRSEADLFAKTIEYYLSKLMWWPLWDVWEKVEQVAFDQTCKNVLKWLSERAEQLSFASDETARADWQRIQSNLAELPIIAADVLGIRRVADLGKEMLPPWRLNVKFETPPVFNFRCRVRLPAWPAMMPVGTLRKWLKKHLQKELEHLAGKWSDAVIFCAADNLRNTLNHLGDEIETQANGIGLRVMASLRNEKSHIADLKTHSESLEAVRYQLLALRAEIINDSPLPSETRIEPANEIVAPPLSQPATDLAIELKTRGCPVCEHLTKVAFHFLTYFQGDLIQNATTQQAFASGAGFCAFHTWQLESVLSPVGASIGFVRLAECVSKILAEKANTSGNGIHLRELSLESKECHVCELRRQAEQDYLQRLAVFISQPNGRSVYAASQGVCLRHLNLLLSLTDEDAARFALQHASLRFEEMSEDMQSFSMKTEALRRDLWHADESDAYLRTVIHLVGMRGNCWPMGKEAKI
ncbi:MAG TPA: dynamin family protein [Verrucomicrobiae bacterium]|nr:dynamin family protein [Verrucomicrobiae bacterium]